MSDPNSIRDTSSHASFQVLARPDSVQHRRTNFEKVFKRLRTVIQRFGSPNKESTNTILDPEFTTVPIDALEVDDNPEESLIEPRTSLQDGTSLPEVEPQLETISLIPSGVARRSLQHDRTRALLEKYGLSIEEHEWISSPQTYLPARSVLRVEKSIRMRVRYSCHICQSVFGSTKECGKCQHKRCISCTRIPPRKKPMIGEDKENAFMTDSDWDTDEDRRSRRAKKVRSRDEVPTVYKGRDSSDMQQPVLQRNRRTCHKCMTKFPAGTAQICTSCGHLRCSRCPREMIHLVWPCGRAGREVDNTEPCPRSSERVFRKPRQRIRWICDHCQTVFLEGSQVCRECLHTRCDVCTRIPPKRVKLDPDPGPGVVHSVQARLAELTIPPSPAVISSN